MNTPSRRLRRKGLPATSLGILAAAIFCHLAGAAEPPAAERAAWEESLRGAGASPAEILQFEGKLHDQSPADFTKMEELLHGASPEKFAGLVLELRREGNEPTPRPLFPDAVPVCAYEGLRNLSIPNTTIDSVALDPIDGSCRVTATVTHPPANDRVRVFIGLPLKGWNGRFRGTGGSGFWGGNVASLRVPLARGYAAGATDVGHEGGSGSFALDASGRLNWQGIRDNAYLGIHDMTVVGKALTQAFYGRAPRHSYFAGLSTGGRQGLMEAQRYPEDYDGILSLSPAINLNRIQFAHLWPQLVMLEAKDFLPKAKLDAATAAAVAACDGSDGVVDGVIDNPTRCTYDPKALVGMKIGNSTFTETDADVVRKIWEGPRRRDRQFLWYGPAVGADLSATAKTGGSPLTGLPFGISLDWVRFFLLQNPQWDWTTLTRGEFELLWNQSVEQYGAVTGSDDPDLTRFRDRGGKVVIVHGLADQLIPVAGTIDYFQRVQLRMGGAQPVAAFARLFLVPGANHGFNGFGLAPTGAMEAVIRWVEDGEAPDHIDAELRNETGKLVRTRPLFPYPQVARYKGSGSTDEAANFVRSTPAQ
jgi:pimeloyl-ACP methyl ester carboxylesterase